MYLGQISSLLALISMGVLQKFRARSGSPTSSIFYYQEAKADAQGHLIYTFWNVVSWRLGLLHSQSENTA